MNLKAAAIDIGTNSCRLLIAEKNSTNSFEILKRGLRITRLGEGVDSSRRLKNSAVERVYEALKEYKKIITDYQVEKIRVVGTSALRDVKNSKILENKIDDLGLELEIISGKKEAELNYLGAVDNLRGNFLLVDIGGGSTEFIWPVNEEINFESLDIGCVRMTERFISTPEEEINFLDIKKMKKYILELLNKKLNLEKQIKIIGVGGTITTAAAMKLKMEKYDSNMIEGTELTLTELKDMVENLSTKPLEERKGIKGLQPKRADIIVAGLVILDSILSFLAINSLNVSDHDLLYGLLKKELAQ